MLQKLLSIFQNWRIRNKIAAICVPFIIIPLCLVIVTSNSIFSKAIIAKTQSIITEDLNLIENRVQTIRSNTEICANTLSKNISRIYDESKEDKNDPIAFLTPRKKIYNEITSTLLNYPDIDSAVFIDMNANVIPNDQKLADASINVLETEIVEALKQVKTPTNVWFSEQIRDYLVTDSKTPVLTLGKRIISPNSGELLGYLFLNIKEATLSSVFPDPDHVGGMKYFIVNQDGMVISTKSKEELLQPVSRADLKARILHGEQSGTQMSMGKKNYLITSVAFNQVEWKLVNQTPVSELTADSRVNSIIIIIIGLVCIIATIIITYYLSMVIARPIVRLTRIANQVKEGQFRTIDGINSKDEVGVLSFVFNEMIGKIQELLEKVKSDQKKQREYELALIQSQIKPHFLYNALDLIYVLNEMGEASKAAETTKSLADFYRISLSKGREVISVQDELKNVQDYMFIQQERYYDILTYSIDVSREILNYPILKLTIQPLVENSIYHGLKPSGQPGHIAITGYEKDDTIQLLIKDDGVGMSAERIGQLLQPNRHNGASHSFGLTSVDERLKLYFGEQYGLKIKSEPGIGTEITITIPKLMEADYHV